ncbi:hypothetical protein [Candidatus Villigracilis proximus]|uniref:hypothetical protein n=1 Tax=Candidatus Villigracilis proximus TaxID=3140683 RepID=UPI0031F1782B
MVFSPEHPLVDKITAPDNKAAVTEYKAQAARQTEIQRAAVKGEKTGVHGRVCHQPLLIRNAFRF